MGGEILWVGVGEGMGVAFSNARTVAWTLALMVASMSISAVALLSVWVSDTAACTVTSRLGGSGVRRPLALPQAKANSMEKTNAVPNSFIHVIPTSAPVLPVQTRQILFRLGAPAVGFGHFVDEFGHGPALLG